MAPRIESAASATRARRGGNVIVALSDIRQREATTALRAVNAAHVTAAYGSCDSSENVAKCHSERSEE
jgi:hypothetical protein